MAFLNFLPDITIGSLSLSALISSVIILIICIVASIIINKVLRKVMKKSRVDKVLEGFIRSAVKVILWILTAVIVAESLGIPSRSLVAAFSVVGLALSLSVQNTLSNLFSGLTILITKPFAAGDFIETPDISGIVKSINLFYTILRTPDNKPVYVPNSDVTKSRISNYSREPHRRLDMTFRASYDDSTEAVKAALTKVIFDDVRIVHDPAPQVLLMSFESSSVKYGVRVWVKNEDYWAVNFSLNEAVRTEFEQAGIKMAYDHLDVRITNSGDRI